MRARFPFVRAMWLVTGVIAFLIMAGTIVTAQASAAETVVTLPPRTSTGSATPSPTGSVSPSPTGSVSPSPTGSATPSPAGSITPLSVPSIIATGSSYATNAWATISAAFSPNAPTATLVATTASVASATTGAPEDECSAATGTAQPTAVAASIGAVSKTCEGGKITIEVSSASSFGNRIGDVIPVNVRIVADSSITIDFTSLMQGILSFRHPSQVKLALEQPVTVNTDTASMAGKTVYLVQLRLQNFLPIPVTFSMDLHYQVNGQSAANRKMLTSPDFVLTNSLTADDGQYLLEGDLTEAPVRQPWAMRPLLIVALVLILAPVVYLLRRWYKRSRPSYIPSAVEAAWKVLTPVFAQCKLGFSVNQVSLIEQAVRVYLKEEYVDIHSLTRQEIVKLMDADSRRESVGKILEICDQILYENRTTGESIVMEPTAAIELVHLVQQVVPEER